MVAFYLSVIDTPEQQSLFELMYYELRDIMYAKAYSILRDEHLSEDAVHTAFFKTAKYFESITDKVIGKDKIAEITKSKNIREKCPKLAAYMVIVVKNVCYDMIESRGRSKEIHLSGEAMEAIEIEEAWSGADTEYISNEEVNKIVQAIRDLSETLSETLYLHLVLEMDAREISEYLDCSYETVRKRIQRGLKELRETLGKRNDTI